MHTQSIPPDRLAAMHDAAKQRAHELRHEAIATLFTQLRGWIAGNARRLRQPRRSTPCHS